MKKQKLKLSSIDDYKKYYQQSIEHPEDFWGDIANAYIDWFKPWSQVKAADFSDKSAHFVWYKDAKLNVSYNCLDRHLVDKAQQTALIWEADDPKLSKRFSYQEIHQAVCKFANVLKLLGVNKGDRVCIYLPMIPEALFAMLACTRIGAIHSVVFAGFSAESLQSRINDAQCQIVITADEGVRGGKIIPLKINADKALEKCPQVRHLLVVKRTGAEVPWSEGRDVALEEALKQVNADCAPVEMDAEDPLYILYTSGSTGKPKGVCHTTAGYLVYAAVTFHLVFNYQPGDVFWCTADVGWVTGHSYIVYGPLANGATTLMFEGVPSYPNFSRFWDVIDKHQVNIFYTAPTAIRALLREGDNFVKQSSRRSLKLLGTVGEPINPDVWQWYFDVVGEKRCPIIDTWWQTETGGIMLTPFPALMPLKPGAASWPFFGVEPVIVNDKGVELQGAGKGQLLIKQSWPAIARTIYGDHQRFINTYLTKFPNYYLTGDGARRDEDNYYWITGRMDDVINVAGHRLGTAEVESALLTHPSVAEAAVVPIPHDIKGQAIYAFVTTRVDFEPSEQLKNQLIDVVSEQISAIAKPEVIQFTVALPKTRSGKIMRRILRKIAAMEVEDLGDISTLAEPSVVDALVEGRKRMATISEK